MKYTKHILAILIISIALAGTIEGKDLLRKPYTGPWVDVKENVTLNTTLPAVPDEVFILKVDDKNIDEPKYRKISENILGIKNPDKKEVKISKRGQMKFSTGKEWNNKYSKNEMVDEQQAKVKAGGYINKLADEDLLAKDMVDLSKLKVEYDEIFVYQDGKKESFVSNQHINAPLSYDGISLHGGGAKVRVYLTKDGEMAGLLNSVGKLKPDKKVAIITPEKAIDILKEEGYKDITINSIELAYEVPPAEENADNIYPVYVFKGVMHNTASGEEISFYTTIPAIKK